MAMTSAPRARNRSRGERAGRAIGAVDDDFHAGEAGAGKNGGAESVEVVVVDFFVVAQAEIAAGFGGFIRGKNKTFDFGFDRVGKFCAGGGNEFHAVVVIRIVRGGNNHARRKTFVADQPGHARSGDDSGGNRFDAGGGEAAGDAFGDVRTGFASVAAN